jgi:hypothetical protein
MRRSNDGAWNQARSVGATATFVAESNSRAAEVRGRQHTTCPML